MASEFTFEGLDEFEAALTKHIEVTYPEKFKEMVITIALELQSTVAERTPVRTTNLQTNWKVGDIIKKGDEYYIEVYNNEEYAEPVEFGHRTTNGGFVAGAHMMEISLAVINARLPHFLRDWLSVTLDELEALL